MGVEEVVLQIRAMGADERRRIRLLLDELEASAEPQRGADAKERGLAAWERLMAGLGTAGGQWLSEGIDEALYRGDR